MKTKEEMLAKIQEKLIMAARPECETLDEAKKKEFVKGCLFRSYGAKIFELSEIIEDKKGFTRCHYGSCGYIRREQVKEILGLPATLPRVLGALDVWSEKKAKENPWNEMEPTVIYFYCQRGEMLHGTRGKLCNWKLKNDDGTDALLEDQSEETIKAIYKLLYPES